MRVNSNMLMGLVLCMVLFGGVAFLTRINKGQHVWTPNDIYSSIGGSSYSIANVSTSTASNSGVTLSLRSSRPILSSARRTTSSVISYAPAQFLPVANNTQYPIGGTPSYSSKGTSALYTTSSATIKSFGGGNAAGASFGGTTRNISSSNNLIASSPSNFIASSYILPSIREDASQYTYGNADRHASALSSTYSSVINSATIGNYAMTLGVINPSAPSYLYDAIREPNTRNAQKSGITNSWQDWLFRHGYEYGTKTGDEENGYTYTFDEWALWEAYEDYINNYWDPMWAQENPSFEEWKQWLENGSEYKGSFYVFQPIGDIWVLLWIAIGYIVLVAYKRLKVNI